MATWNKTTETATMVFYQAIINGGDTSTDILLVPAAWQGSITIKHGGTDALSIELSTAATPANANMVVANTSVTEDYENPITSPISALRFSGASAQTHNIFLCFKKNWQ